MFQKPLKVKKNLDSKELSMLFEKIVTGYLVIDLTVMIVTEKHFPGKINYLVGNNPLAILP